MKRAQQTEAREHHTNQIKLKARRQAKELQGELAIDMKILEALLTETENEKEEAVKRKVGNFANVLFKQFLPSLILFCQRQKAKEMV